MSLLSMIRNHFRPDPDCFGVNESQVVIEESKQARVQMVEQTRQARHDAFQTSVEQQQIRSDILGQILVRKPRPDFLEEFLANEKGDT